MKWRNTADDKYLLQAGSDFFTEDSFEGVFLHPNDMNRRELPLRHSGHNLHADE